MAVDVATEGLLGAIQGKYHIDLCIDHHGTNTDYADRLLLDDGAVDLSELARETFILNMPSKTLCREDCRGLCSGCGVNLNYEKCRCKKEVDPRLAALAKLLEQ